MSELSPIPFSNPVWHALHGPHRHFALVEGNACRYPAEVAPFAAVAEPSEAALRELHALLASRESLWIIDPGRPLPPGLLVQGSLDCVQMVFPAEAATPPAPTIDLVALSGASAHEMLALTDVAFPGFFRARTHRMGSYFGVRQDGELVAMAGERLRLEGYPELSAICTHPEHRGRGLATHLIHHLVRTHRRAGLTSWLHVGAPNTHAIELYSRLGFKRVRNILLSRIARS